MYGGTMLPPHPPMAEGPGGPMYNGLHAGDPAWSPIIKVVPNNADNSDPQQQVNNLFVLTSHMLGAELHARVFCRKFDLIFDCILFKLSPFRCGLVPGHLMWAVCT